ncbi:MAG: hypothetical protein JWN99_628 [Ilumatobacteraceae bacterium]|nr:hypothetical protein [Ilumatobacteraceae bacterium]
MWFVIVLLIWAVPSQTDSVPVGVDQTLVPPQPVSIDVACNSLFDSAARPDTPLPILTAQPKQNAPLAFQREPCVLPHDEARILFAIDTAVLIAGLGLLGAVAVRGRRADRAERASAPAFG